MTAAPSQQELSSLAAACQRLWGLDVNGLHPGQDYNLNPQVAAPRNCLRSNAVIPYNLCVVATAWQEVLYGARRSTSIPFQSSEPCGLSAETHLCLVLFSAR